MSMVSAGCVLWLEHFQPLFVTVAILTLGYQAWLVWRRPAHRRTSLMRLMLWTSACTNLGVGLSFVVLWLRYR